MMPSSSELSGGMRALTIAQVSDLPPRPHATVDINDAMWKVVDAPGGGARFAIELPLRNGTALLTSRI